MSPVTALSHEARGRTKRRRPRRQRSVSISSASSEDIPLVALSRRGKAAKPPASNDHRARAPRHDDSSCTRSEASPTRDLEDVHPSSPSMSYDDFRAQIRGMHGQMETTWRTHAPQLATRGVRFEESVLTFATRRESYYTYEPERPSPPLFSTPERPAVTARQQHRQHAGAESHRQTQHQQLPSPMYAALAQALRDGHGSPEPADERNVPIVAVSPPPPPPLVPTPVFQSPPTQATSPPDLHSPGPQLSPALPLSPVLPPSPVPPPAVTHRSTNVQLEQRSYTSHPTRSSPELMDIDMEEMEVDEVDDSMHIDTSQDDYTLPSSPALEPVAIDRTFSARSLMDTAETPEVATVALEPDEEDEDEVDAIDLAIDLDMQDRLAQRAQAQAAARMEHPEPSTATRPSPVVHSASRLQSTLRTPSYTVGEHRSSPYDRTSFVTATDFGSPLRKHMASIPSRLSMSADRGSSAKQFYSTPHQVGSAGVSSSEDRAHLRTLEELQLRADKLSFPETFDDDNAARSPSPGHTCRFNQAQEASPWCRCAARTFAHAREARKSGSPLIERPPANAQNNRPRPRH